MKNSSDMSSIQKLVGDIGESDLKNVDYYIRENLGIFIPSVGYCGYAIKPRHIHPAYSFFLFFSKEQSIFPVEIAVPVDCYLVTAFSPGVPHEEKQKESFTRYMAIMIAPEFYHRHRSLYGRPTSEPYCRKQFLVKKDIMTYLKKFLAEYEGKLPGSHKELDALSTVIAHELIRGVLKIDGQGESAADRLEIQQMIEYIHQHYGQKLTIAGLAKLANMSASHFIRIFKKDMGIAPMEYLIRTRIEKAKKLLRNRAKPITEISLQCGFGSASHFSACFTKHFGITPREYRNIYSKQPK